MNPNTIILTGMCAIAGAGLAYGAYAVSKGVTQIVKGIKEENREYQRELAKP